MTTRGTQPKVAPDEALIDLIVAGGLRPGDQLPTEDALAADLQISRNSVREAVRELRAIGILEIRRPQGTFLRDGSLLGLTRGLSVWARLADRDGLEAVQPIADVREVLEVTLIGRVVDRLGAMDLRDIDRTVREMESAARSGEYHLDADRRFHQAVFRPLENWVFSYLLESFWEVYGTVRHLVDRTGWSPDANAALHRDVYLALVAKDSAAAAAAMARHFDHSLRAAGNGSAPVLNEAP